MFEEVQIDRTLPKKEQYETLLVQIKSVVEGESDRLANMANIMAVLKYELNFFWVGTYFIQNTELVLGPFQGPLACTRIGYGKGVCGKSWEEQRTITVPDVNKFQGHIACSSHTQSEIVIPIRQKSGNIIGVLDVDSDTLNSFDADDEYYLGKIADLIGGFHE